MSDAAPDMPRRDVNLDIYWAVVLRHRWSSWFDAPERHLVQEREGKLDAANVLRISSGYSVRRGLNLVPSGQAIEDEAKAALRLLRAGELADLLNKLFSKIPADIVERAGSLSDIATAIGAYTHNQQVSAVSKFLWFVAPAGWTVFDSLASRALRTSGHIAYYNRLEELGFSHTVSTIGSCLADNGLSDMWAERVVDQYLLLRASESKSSLRDIARAYLATLPSDRSLSLDRAATSIAAAVSGDKIFTESV